MQGFAVFDTRRSSEYAVALCATKKGANDYPLEAPKPQDEEMFTPEHKPTRTGRTKAKKPAKSNSFRNV